MVQKDEEQMLKAVTLLFLSDSKSFLRPRADWLQRSSSMVGLQS